jgi:TPR repeat protein/DNA-binding transcriptional regulator GbsR (MarR family)
MVEQEKSSLTMQGKFRTVASIYNPDLLSKQQLIGSFVVRLKKFNKLFEEIRTSDMTHPEQPLMIVGLRGMGKTTLLLRLSYEVENNEDLNKWLVPIVFNEEEYGITKLYKFWEHIAQYFERKEPAIRGLFDLMDSAYDLINDDVRYEQKAFQLLMDALHKQGKKLLLFVDNFGDMFKRFNKQEKQRLREVVMTCTDLRIIAGSSVVAEAFYKYDDPFYELFKMERLEGLNKEETESLLLQLGESYPVNPVKEILAKQPNRVETLRRLTGGIPRSMVLLFEIFVDDKDGNAFTDLESILDRVTPLYKHRMDELPAQQQEIVNAIAHAWDAVSAKEIAQKTRLDSKLVSAQLKQLHQNNIVDKQPTHNKNHLYLLHDRFFNIWYLMRMARKGDKNRVLWLIRFLEQWCDEEQLSKRSDSLMRAFNKGEYNPKGAYYLSTALHFAETHDLNKRHELSKQTQRYLESKDPNLHEQLAYSDMAVFGKAMDLVKKKDFEEARLELITIKDKNSQDYLLLSALNQHLGKFEESDFAYQKAVSLKAEHPERVLGNIYRIYLKDNKIAETYYLKAIDKGDFKAFRKLGWLYEDKFKDIEKAENCYWQAIEKGDATEGWRSLANLYRNKKKDYIKAEKYYFKACEEGNTKVLRLLGLMYRNQLKNIDGAEDFYRQAIDKGDSEGWCSLANLYQDDKKDYVKAEKYYIKANEEGHTNALRLLGRMYQFKLKDVEKAENLYNQAIEKGDTEGWRFLANLYFQDKKDYAKAEECYLKASEEGYPNALRQLGWMYEFKLKNIEKAEDLYNQAIESGDTEGWCYLADLYRDEKKDYVKAEEYYLKASEEGHADALSLLGWMYQFKLKDVEKAENLYNQAIEKGDTEGWRYLADLYRDEKKDYVKAEEYYLKASKEGHIEALRILGWMYQSKLKNIEKAESFYNQVIEKGDITGWRYLADLYKDEKKDYVKAEEYYLKANEEGQTEALRLLGLLYQFKLKNIEKAESFYNQAIEKGDIRGWRYLADLYRDEKKDYTKAEEYYLHACEVGDNGALRLLGWLYESKLKNIEKAEFFYHRAIEKGETYAWLNLAFLYEEEKKDYLKAEELFIKANDEKQNTSLRWLGWMYESKLKNIEKAENFYRQAIENGDTKEGWRYLADLYNDEKKDYLKAEEYYLKANNEGNAEALLYLGSMYAEKLSNIEKAETYYAQVIEKGDELDTAYNAWAWAYFKCKVKPKEALDFALKAHRESCENDKAHTLACILLWNGSEEQAKEITEKFMYDSEFFTDNEEYITLILLFLAKHQYDFIYNYFTSEKGEEMQLKDRFKPVWYTMLYYMQDKYPTDYLRMPPEIKETVQEAIAKVEQMRVDYTIA